MFEAFGVPNEPYVPGCPQVRMPKYVLPCTTSCPAQDAGIVLLPAIQVHWTGLVEMFNVQKSFKYPGW
jgi:hypothetical protein